MEKIVDGLYLGDIRAAQNLDMLVEFVIFLLKIFKIC